MSILVFDLQYLGLVEVTSNITWVRVRLPPMRFGLVRTRARGGVEVDVKLSCTQ